MKKVEEIKDKIEIEGLPGLVKSIFSLVIGTGRQKPDPLSSSYDLRNVDKTILNSLFPFQLNALK